MIVRGFSMITSVSRGGRFVLERPAILEGLAPGGLEAAGRVGDRAPSATAVRVDPCGRIEHPPTRGIGRLGAGEGGREERLPGCWFL